MKAYSSLAATLLCTLALVTPLAAEEESADEAKARAQIQKLVGSLNFQQGEITLGGGVAKLNLPENLRYLDPKDTKTVLVTIWGNMDDEPSLGLIVPKGFDPIEGNTWAVDINYEEDGYVKDNDAESINYDELLKSMQAGATKANAERIKAGYEPVEIVGWAAKPHYDRGTHKLYWAKQLKFGNSPEDTLNYNIRILGRRGVLVLNVIAGMPQLAEVEAATPEILNTVEFTPGNRYADFNASTDKVATYGIAALVAGGVAAKMGFFKGLWLAILAGKKFIIIGAVALFVFIKKLIGGKQA